MGKKVRLIVQKLRYVAPQPLYLEWLISSITGCYFTVLAPCAERRATFHPYSQYFFQVSQLIRFFFYHFHV